MSSLRQLLAAVVAIEFLAAVLLCGWRMNSTQPAPPPVETWTDAITGAELLAVPNKFLFDGVTKWQTLGETYIATGFFSKGEACLRRAAECDPDSSEIPMSHGFCLERLGLLEEARDVYHRAATHGQTEIVERAWYALGRIFLQLEQAAEADEAFRTAGEHHLPSVYQRAKLLVRDGQALEAKPLLKQLADAQPDDLNVLQLQAQAADNLGDADAAADFRDAAGRARAILDLIEQPQYYMVDGDKYGFNGEVARLTQHQSAAEEAVSVEKLLKLARDGVRWENAMNRTFLEDSAKFALEAGRPEAARSFLEQMIFIEDMPSARAWGLLGDVEYVERNTQKAWQDWNRSERILPGATDHGKLVQFAEQSGDKAAVQRHQGPAKQSAGIVAYGFGQFSEARTELRAAVAADPALVDAYYYLGECERLLADRRKAEAAFRQCLKLNPDHGRALAQLRR